MSDAVKNHCPVPAGTLLIIGGKENKGENTEDKIPIEERIRLEVLTAFVELIGKENPIIEVISTASEEGEASFQDYHQDYHRIFTQLGIKNINHLRHESREQLLKDQLDERMNQADAFFFTGGDQLLLTAIYGGTPFLTHLKNRYIGERIVIAGTSAGAMAMSTPMIYAGSKDVAQIGGEIKITTGLEFLKDVCIDTHFVERGRFVRMAQVIITNPGCLGMGIEEDTAMIVRNGLDVEVIGSGTIICIDGSEISDSNIREFTDKVPVKVRGLRVDLLSKGDKYRFKQPNPPHI